MRLHCHGGTAVASSGNARHCNHRRHSRRRERRGRRAPADVGIRDGRIVAIGDRRRAGAHDASTPPASSSPPGFVDPAHALRRPALLGPATRRRRAGTASPPSIGGNCGFTLAPLHGPRRRLHPPDDGQVEGMPLVALEQGVPLDVGQLRRVPRRAGRAASRSTPGFMVGHCALRRYVMGDDAVGRGNRRRSSPRCCSSCTSRWTPAGSGFSTTPLDHALRRRRPAGRRVATRQSTRAARAVRRRGRARGHARIEAIMSGCLDRLQRRRDRAVRAR